MHVLKHSWLNNGHVHVAVDLACAQADAGHDVFFAHAHGSFDDLMRAHGVTLVEVPEPKDVRSAAQSGLALLRAVRRHRPQIVHAHMVSSAVLAYPVAKLMGAALVTTVHNSFDKQSFLMRLGKVVVAVSEAERKTLLSRGFPPRKTVAVLNGAALSPREALPLQDIGHLHTPAVLSMSGLHPRKAVNDIITAFSTILPDFSGWHLNIVGWGPSREALEEHVRQLGIGESVHFLGPTLTPKPLLAEAEVFVSASLADPCPLTTTEARYAGLAIVATAVGGVPEVLEYGRAGLLVPPSDPEAMAAALRQLLSDPQALMAWRERAKQGSEYLTVPRVAADYERVYRTVVRD
jgi:glycosyltransferase involved in cell wall biosynthesis